MCSACGIPTHILELGEVAPADEIAALATPAPVAPGPPRPPRATPPIGASMQTSMPIFAHDLGAGSAGSAYGVLLFANGAGGVIGGVLLEATGRIRPSVRAAVASTAIYGVTRSSSPSRPAIRSPSACS